MVRVESVATTLTQEVFASATPCLWQASAVSSTSTRGRISQRRYITPIKITNAMTTITKTIMPLLSPESDSVLFHATE